MIYLCNAYSLHMLNYMPCGTGCRTETRHISAAEAGEMLRTQPFRSFFGHGWTASGTKAQGRLSLSTAPRASRAPIRRPSCAFFFHRMLLARHGAGKLKNGCLKTRTPKAGHNKQSCRVLIGWTADCKAILYNKRYGNIYATIKNLNEHNQRVNCHDNRRNDCQICT